MKSIIFVVSFIFLLMAAPWQASAKDYPSRRITLIVPFAPGGTSDTIARPFAHVMGEVAGKPVIVLNKPGAAGEVGMAYVSRARPDGYTLLIALPSITTIPITDKLTGKTPLYQDKQFEAIARLTSDPTIVATRTNAKWKTLAELVKDAQSRPNQITFGTAGVYSVSDISMLLLSTATKMSMLQVPYESGGELILALLSGQINIGSNTYATLSPYFKSGKLRPLVVQGDERLSTLPNVPTTKDLGYDAAAYAFWSGIFAPSGLPPDVDARLRSIIKKVVADPAFVKAMHHLGATISYLDQPQFTEFWHQNGKHQIAVIESFGKLASSR